MEDQNIVIEMTAEIVASYVANNSVAVGDLPGLIQSVSQTLNSLGQPQAPSEPETEKPSTAQIRKSVRPDGLVSFIDGKTYKTLKRHLTTNGMTVADYKAKFGLPSDYPTTSPDYSAKRSEMARSLGLGRKSGSLKAAAAKSAPRKEKKTKVVT